MSSLQLALIGDEVKQDSGDQQEKVELVEKAQAAHFVRLFFVQDRERYEVQAPEEVSEGVHYPARD